MPLEVELKFPLSDPAPVERRLAELGAVWHPPVEQIDRYYNHPCRDFAQTDEALRIRSVGEPNFITYKGAKLDATTKTRHEIELPLGNGQQAAAQYGELLEALGFRFVLAVEKRRRPGVLAWRQQQVELAWDRIDGLGQFLELELASDEAGQEAAKACLASLAHELDLQQAERRSYLELLLAQTQR